MSFFISIIAGLVSVIILVILRNFALTTYKKRLTFSVYFYHKNYKKLTLFIISSFVYLLILALIFPYFSYLDLKIKVLFLFLTFIPVTLVFQTMDKPFSTAHQIYYYIFFPSLLIPICNFVLVSKQIILLVLVLISFAILGYLPIVIKTKITAYHQSMYLFVVLLIYIVGLNYM